MGQLIWRYHPETRRYEVFAEGGGNAFGVEIDSKGRIFSGHNGGNTRGFHYVQGGYYQKGFSKHGPLSNPYAFGYFPAMRHPDVPRFTHTFTFYEADALPERHRGKLFAVAPMQSHVVSSAILPDGSTFHTKDTGHPVTTTDSWFRPVDIKLGPDGALYVADWYDGQVNHYRNHEGQIDPSNGRIYRLKAKGAKAVRPVDLSGLTTMELIRRLSDPNRWVRQTALRLLGDRKDPAAITPLTRLLGEKTGQLALEALWALNLSGGLDEKTAGHALAHADPHVRLWTVRLLGDRKQVAPPLAAKLTHHARTELHPEVRSQLACTARRLPGGVGLAIVGKLLARGEDVKDPHIPLLLWWAIEAKADSDPDQVLDLFARADVWRLPMVEQHILERLMRRYAQAGTRKHLLICARLLQLAPDASHAKRLLTGFEQAFTGRPLPALPDELVKAMAARGGGSLSLRLRQGDPKAVDEALKRMAESRTTNTERLQLVQIFGEARLGKTVPTLLQVISATTDTPLRLASLSALQPFDDPSIPDTLLRMYPRLPGEVQAGAQALLLTRKAWTRQFLQAVAAGRVERKSIPLDVVRRMTLHRDDDIARLVDKLWGKVQGATTAQMQKQIAALEEVLRSGTGSPYGGKKLFEAGCAKCHTLFGQGGQVGPDLTAYRRDDVATLLLHLVNPSAEIREGYETTLILTTDGRTLTGFVVDQDNRVVVLRGAEGQTVSVDRKQIEEQRVLPQSLMPEGLLDGFSPQQVRDLFAYLRSTQPLNE